MKMTSFTRTIAIAATVVGCALSVVPSAMATVATHAVIQAAVAKPVITKQPAATRAVAGNAATFAVSASGQGVLFRWQEKLVGHNWTSISGATGARLVVTATPSRNRAQYRALVQNYGGQIISVVAGLSVFTSAPVLTRQPAGVAVTSGTVASFSVAGSGYALTYQWQVKMPGKAWSNIAQANRSSYGITTSIARSGFQFRVVLATAGGTVVSNPAGLSVVGTRNDPYRPGTAVNLKAWQVKVGSTNINADLMVKNNELGDPPRPGYHYVTVFVGVRYMGSGSRSPYYDLDVDFVGSNGLTYTKTNRFYWNNSIYSIDPMYQNATAEFAAAVEVPASAITGGRWIIEDSTDYSDLKSAWFGLS